MSSVWDGTVGETSRRNTHLSELTLRSTHTPSKVTLHHFPCQRLLLLLMKGAEPWSPCSLITVLIMLPGNNMHFIFFPSLCLYHLHPHPPLFSCPIPLHLFCLGPVLFVTYSVPSCPLLCFLSSSFCFSLSHLDFQSCLICVARRVPMKERPMLPTHESFTTRQDLQGTLTSHTGQSLKLISHSQSTQI